MSFQIRQNNLICIQTQFIEKTNGSIVVLKSANDLEKWKKKGYSSKNSAKTIQSLTTYWKSPTWKEHITILSQSVKFKSDVDGNTTQCIDPFLFRQNKINTCLKKWDIIDEKNKPVPVSVENIDNLPAEIVNELLSHFEELTEIKSDDIKQIEDTCMHFFKGKGDKAKIADYESVVPYIYEHIICRNYQVLPNLVRELDYFDFNIHLRLCIIKEQLEKEFMANLSGVKTGSSGGGKKAPATRKGGGLHKSMQQTKLIKFEDGRRPPPV